MGQEIESHCFTPEDYAAFDAQLQLETQLLSAWFDDGVLADEPQRIGFELEAWLVDSHGYPAAKNAQFLAGLDDPNVVPELSKFNVEINSEPLWLEGHCFQRLQENLTATLAHCQTVATSLEVSLAMLGILPTVRESDLVLGNISAMQRYYALNQQIVKMRQHQTLEFDIRGQDHWQHSRDDFMMESATTSFQIHLQVGVAQAPKLYNLSKILSGPMVAISANSPYLFGHHLWSETRIPLFEQSIDVGATAYGRRVTFGNRYVEHSLFECFQANLHNYPVMLPRLSAEPREQLPHLRLHNGTIWRWNRPLVGFSEGGQAHLRIEHRVVPAGPTLVDSVANAAFYFGLLNGFNDLPSAAVADFCPFQSAQHNFYQGAKMGLAAEMIWQGKRHQVSALITDVLLPKAKLGLQQQGIADADIQQYLGIIEGRVRKQQNGAIWQTQFVQRFGQDMQALTMAYLDKQRSDVPVHEWGVTC